MLKPVVKSLFSDLARLLHRRKHRPQLAESEVYVATEPANRLNAGPATENVWERGLVEESADFRSILQVSLVGTNVQDGCFRDAHMCLGLLGQGRVHSKLHARLFLW